MGIRDRLDAYLLAHGGEIPDNFRVVYHPFDISSSTDRPDLMAAIKKAGMQNPVVVIDTMTRATPGLDLNGPKDMGSVIKGLDEVQRGLGGLIGTLYHSTIKSGGNSEDPTEMGHSSYRGSLDSSILVYERDGIKYWHSKKVKDAASGEDFPFRISPYQVHLNQWGRPKTSCAVIPMTQSEAASVQEHRLEEERRLAAIKFFEYLRDQEQLSVRDRGWNGAPRKDCLDAIGGRKENAIKFLTTLTDLGAVLLFQKSAASNAAKFYRFNPNWDAPEEFQPFPPPEPDLSVWEEDADGI